MNRRQTMLALAALGAVGRLQPGEAQISPRPRQIAVLMGYAEDDAEAQSRLATFRSALPDLGWREGRNLKIEVRWTAGDLTRAAAHAKELVGLQPEVIVSNTTPATLALQRETQTIPIVFAVVSDPVGSGLVKTLSRPGGNITGFINLESSLVEKWLELLKEIAPQVSRVAVMFNRKTAPYAEYYLRPLNIAAERLGVKTFSVVVGSPADIEDALNGLAREAGSGLIAMPDSYLFVHRRTIVDLTARGRVPAIYWVGNIPSEGGLIAYGVDYFDIFRRSAGYVDRILRGAKPADLPVEQPHKFELVINARAARALGLSVPSSLALRAERVIE